MKSRIRDLMREHGVNLEGESMVIYPKHPEEGTMIYCPMKWPTTPYSKPSTPSTSTRTAGSTASRRSDPTQPRETYYRILPQPPARREGHEVEILLEREGGTDNPDLGKEKETGEPSSSSEESSETPGEPDKRGESSRSKVLEGPEPKRRTISAGGASFIPGRQSRTHDRVTRADKEVRGNAEEFEPRGTGNKGADNYGDTRTGSEVSRPETIDLATSEADSTETGAEHSGHGQPGKQKQKGADRGKLRKARSGRKMVKPTCKFFTRGNCSRGENCQYEHVRYRQDNYMEQKEKVLRQSLKKKKEDLEKLKRGTDPDQSQSSSGSKRSSGGEPRPKRQRRSSSPPRRRDDARRK